MKKQKIRLTEIVRAFDLKDGTPVIVHVFDSISDFSRKVKLMKNFKEVKDIYQAYIDQRQKIVDELMKSYAESKGKEIKDFAGQPVPEAVKLDFETKVRELLETEVDYTAFVFDKKEIEQSGITISEMEKIEIFTNFK